MYGRAKFDLLRIRVLSPAKKAHKTQDTKTGGDHKQQKRSAKELGAGGDTPNPQHIMFRISEVDTAGESL